MPVSKPPRKRGPVRLAPPRPVIPALWRYPSAQETMLCLLPHSALSDFEGARASNFHAEALAFRIHMGKALATRYAPHVLDEVNAAADIVAQVRAREMPPENQYMTSREAKAVRLGLCYTDDLQSATTREAQREVGKELVRSHLDDLHTIGISSRARAEAWLD